MRAPRPIGVREWPILGVRMCENEENSTLMRDMTYFQSDV